MTDHVEFIEYKDREAASAAAAERLAEAVRRDLDAGGEASLVLSGGTTPGRCFDILSEKPLDWSRVTLLPSDERWVPPDDPNSNERLIRERLLRGAAAPAKILPFYRPGLEPEAAPAAISGDLERLQRPISGVLLGMGGDGHFASLFPDFGGLRDALNPRGTARCVLVSTAASPILRISLTLAQLLRSKQRILLCFGAAKRSVLREAVDGESALPVAELLGQENAPVEVLWAP